MSGYHKILISSSLFVGISEGEIEPLLSCLSAKKRQYEKNAFIFSENESVSSVGLILSGGVHVIKEDYWGNRDILAHLGPGELFAEAFSCAEMAKLPVSVIAIEKAEVLLIDCQKIITTCPTSCAFHTRLIQNLLQILASKNILLMQKIEQLSKRTTKEKLLAYLSAESKKAASSTFTIPFNREELADYLSVDRSAMSNELSKMRDAELLTFSRNHFELK